jgi:hypothetical protein
MLANIYRLGTNIATNNVRTSSHPCWLSPQNLTNRLLQHWQCERLDCGGRQLGGGFQKESQQAGSLR